MPYTFLSGNGILSYNDLGKHPHYVDARGRQVFATGRGSPTLIYVRIPKNITTEENRRQVAQADRLDIPQVGEELVLSRGSGFGRKGSSEREGPEVRVTVMRRLAQKTATALLEVSDDVEAPEGLDVDSDDETPDALLTDAERAFKARKNDQQQRRLARLEESAEKRAQTLREHGYSFEEEQESHRYGAPLASPPHHAFSMRRPSAVRQHTVRSPHVSAVRAPKVAKPRAKRS